MDKFVGRAYLMQWHTDLNHFQSHICPSIMNKVNVQHIHGIKYKFPE